jgi:hypothetical protein
MKNKFTLCLLAGGLLLSSLTFAGENKSKKGDGGDVFSEKSLLLNIGIGVPWLGYTYGSGYYGNYATPSFSGSLEGGVHKWISVGGFLEFDASGYYVDYGNFYYNGATNSYYSNKRTYTYTNIGVGAKGSFHFSAIGNEKWGWNINTSKIDLYASAFLGVAFDINSYSDSYNNSTSNNGSGARPIGGVAAGARYLFSPSFGVFGEVGPSPLGWVVGGLTFKLK